MIVAGRQSAHAIYDERFVTFGEDNVYQQADAGGFIRLYGLPYRVRALKDAEMGYVPSWGTADAKEASPINTPSSTSA